MEWHDNTFGAGPIWLTDHRKKESFASCGSLSDSYPLHILLHPEARSDLWVGETCGFWKALAVLDL